MSNFVDSTTDQQQQQQQIVDSHEVPTLIAAHLNLLGERLKEISRSIEACVAKGDSPNIDRSLDIILDTILYSSTVFINLFESVEEIKRDSNRTEAEIDRELTQLAIFHLTTSSVATNQRGQQTNQQQQQQQKLR